MDALPTDDVEVFRDAQTVARIHDLAIRNPRAANVIFKMLPGQSKGMARIRAMLPQL